MQYSSIHSLSCCFTVFCLSVHSQARRRCRERSTRLPRARGGVPRGRPAGAREQGAITAEGLRPCPRITGRQMGMPRAARRLAGGPGSKKADQSCDVYFLLCQSELTRGQSTQPIAGRRVRDGRLALHRPSIFGQSVSLQVEGLPMSGVIALQFRWVKVALHRHQR